MKIAFIDHPFHRKTRSSDFFLSILNVRYEVDLFYPGSDWRVVTADVLGGNYDVVICWQHEFFAPIFAAEGLPTIIIPMFDGSGGCPSAYWQFFNKVGIQVVNFSEALHRQHLDCGMESLKIKYFPDPNEYQPVDDFEELNGFFWQRDPLSGLDWMRVQQMLVGQLDRFHVHNIPDSITGGSRFDFNEWRCLENKVSFSEWFEKKADYLNLVQKSNVFIAPRLSEGIGLATLDAMAYGQCVIAHNHPTMNEYIIDGENGHLFYMHSFEPINLKDAKANGAAARLTVEGGFVDWERDINEVYDFIESLVSSTQVSLHGRVRDVCREFPALYFKKRLMGAINRCL